MINLISAPQGITDLEGLDLKENSIHFEIWNFRLPRIKIISLGYCWALQVIIGIPIELFKKFTYTL
jgi:hypothetical protein